MFWRNSIFRLISLLLLYFCCASYLPLWVNQFLYSVSLTIKHLIVWLMPFIICFYVAFTIKSFEKEAHLFLLAIVCFEGLSNFISTWYGYSLGSITTGSVSSFCGNEIKSIESLWSFPFQKPVWYSADKGSLLGIFIGFMCLVPRFKNTFSYAVDMARNSAQIVLTNFFRPIIPIFVLGFVANLYCSGTIGLMYKSISSMLPYLCIGLMVYIFMLFALSSGKLMPIKAIKNLLPAGLLSLSSGCSLSTMPWTIEGTRKNMKNPPMADAIIPATTNIQQIGDCIANTFLCFVLYKQFYGCAPSLSMWLSFSIVFTMARFTTSAVLGGAIFIMLPVYEQYLNFTPSMTAIILAFNVIMDPIITSANVMANGALCSVFENVWLFFKRILPLKAFR